MKLVKKNDYVFATGMFWQIPDEGKRFLSISKLTKDTKNNMFCHIKVINTWGFCRKEELNKEKKVASFGKYIIEASGLSTEYSNSIICFKFKNAGEIADDGKQLECDLYGYIVLLNGTICPDEGEYVAKIDMVRTSIYEKAAKHDIETLYLPVEVSSQFFDIFEILVDANNNEELLLYVMANLTKLQHSELKEFISESYPNSRGFMGLLNNQVGVDIGHLRELIKTPLFEKKLRSTKEKNLKYLIPNILILPYISDEIYWEPEKLKKNFNKCLIESTSARKVKNYKIAGAAIIVGVLAYIAYTVFLDEEQIIQKPVQKVVIPKAVAADPQKLITACLAGNDSYFSDLGKWRLVSVKCNSLGAAYTFNSHTEATLSDFANLIGKNDNSIKFSNMVGTYTEKYNISSFGTSKNPVRKETILSNLQQSGIDYGVKITTPQSAGQKKLNPIIKYSIASRQSPVFLYNHHVLDNLKINEISMSLDNNTGFYNWTIQGEF